MTWLGLRGRVLTALMAAAVIPAVLVGVLAVRNARRDVQTEVVRGHLALVRAVGANLDTTLQDVRRALTLAASAWADHPQEAERTLRRVRRLIPLVQDVWILDADLRPVAGTPMPLEVERANTYGGYIAEVCPSGDAPCTDVVVVAQARARTGELVGFFVARLDLSFADEALALARLGQNARMWMVDSRGVPVVGEGRPSPRAIERALASATEGSLLDEDMLAVYRNLASFQTTRGLGWALILEQPARDAFAVARATARDTLLVGLICLAAAIPAGVFLAGHLTRPLRQLAAHVEAFAAPGDRAGPPLPLSAPGEIGGLARHVAEMEGRVAERERLQAAVSRSAQLASVGALAAGVAHEVNNPMTTILGYASLLAEDLAPDDPRRASLDLVAEEARRVQAIVRTLLDHSRLEKGPEPPTDVDVAALVVRVARLVEPTLKQRRIRLVQDVEPGLPPVRGQPYRLAQVLVNLAQNGAQAMGDGGGTLTLAARRGGGEIVVEIGDTGPGIPAEHLTRLFEPFFTTKGPGVGTGLGLAISHQIVLDHGGRIEVESHVGVGSKFRVFLEPA